MSTMSDERTTDETARLPRDEQGPPSREQPTTSRASSFDPTLWVALVAGAISLFALVVGIVTLARTGVPIEGLTDATTEVGPFDRSALMGFIEVGIGLIAATIAASRRAASLTGLGLIAIVFGLVWLIEPNAFGDALGVNRGTAWLYLAFGAVATGVGLWAPNTPQDRVVVRH